MMPVHDNSHDDLDEYRRKRDFGRTPEPAGRAGERGGIFVVQKHAARHLHYDFRLELDGVLKSWAVPKGPSTDPQVKRLAMHVEDHPLEYASFEGIIPKGEYGGGTVMVWDNGYWRPEGDAAAAYRKGMLKFSLAGKKLHGKWMLVRSAKRSGEDEKEAWFLMKERDDFASSRDVTELDRSAASGRTMEEIALRSEAVWTPTEGRVGEEPQELSPVSGGRPAPLPAFIEPQLATLVKEVPAGEGWVHELKYDGYRLLVRIEGGSARLVTRKGKEWTERFPSLAAAASTLGLRSAWLDGEAVVLDRSGISSFQAMQNVLATGNEAAVIYYAFDLLYLDGIDLRELPLARRKEILAVILEGKTDGRLRYSDHVAGSGNVFFSTACKYMIEGVVSKRADLPYSSGRGRGWLKVKCHNRQEFVIGGYSEPSGGRKGFGALLLGAHAADGTLVYRGKVGTGFNERSLAALYPKLTEREVPSPPFANPPRGADARGVHWVRPELVAEVAYTEVTREGVLRHPSFQGLREDKSAGEVMFEEPPANRAEEPPAAAPPAPAEEEPLPPAGSIAFRLTNPEKLLYTADGISKWDVAVYYRYIHDRMLPHLRRRPLTLVRCPEGVPGECFFQKHDNVTVPPPLTRIQVSEEGEIRTYLCADTLEALLGLVQMGILEIHTWGSRYDTLEFPDKLVFDLDPDEGLPWERLAEGALLVRTHLLEMGLETFVKTTGGKGFHVVVPVEPEYDWETVKLFCRDVAEELVARHPGKFTAKMGKEKRPGRIFIDWMRNGRGATAVEVFSTRAKPGAPLSVPVAWEELVAGVAPGQFTLENIGRRLASQERDPWEEYFQVSQRLSPRQPQLPQAP